MSPNPATDHHDPSSQSSVSSTCNQSKSGIDLNGVSADPYIMDSLTEKKDKQDPPAPEEMIEKEKEDGDLNEKSVEVEDVNILEGIDFDDEEDDFDFDINSASKDGKSLKDTEADDADAAEEEAWLRENVGELETSKGETRTEDIEKLETSSVEEAGTTDKLEETSKAKTGNAENIAELEIVEGDGDGDPAASENENPTTDDKVDDADEKQQAEAEKVRQTHLKKDAELEAYLESLKPKPKPKSIKERLMSMPGFKDVAFLKPKIGGAFEKKEVIFLDDESLKKESVKDLKRRQEIEALKDRFVRQVITAPAKPQKDHIKLKIKKKEEDSQGVEHLVEEEVEYVRNPLNEEEEAVGFIATPQIESPKANAPGAQRRHLRDSLLAKIRAQKRKEHEERLKKHAMDNDEIDIDEKEDYEEEDEVSSEESELGEEEEELEDLLDGSEKKKKKKCKYVEDEAEDEDEDDGDDDDEDDDEDDDDDTEPEEDIEQDSASAKDINEENVPLLGESKDLDSEDSALNKPHRTENLEGSRCDLAASPLVVIPRVDTWSRSNQSKKDALWSPLLHVLKNAKSQEMERSEDSVDPDKVPESLAKVITNTENDFGNLADLCSGRFISQVENAAVESQEDEYAGFDFGDDDDVVAEDKSKETDEIVKTPQTAANARRTAVDGVTPKLSEKISKTRLVMQFEEADKRESSSDVTKEKSYEMGDSQENRGGDDADDDEEDDIVLTRTRVLRKKKRLQFSDDEDDDADAPDGGDDSKANQTESEDEAEEEEMEEEVITPVEPNKSNPFFNKFGRLKRKFVEDEAELSGSDEGSADEDEKGLNHYELDEADEEEFDEDEVREKVGHAHLQQLLDEDDKDIRDLQERLLENGDLHKDKQRERKFRWMNLNAMDDDAVMGDSDDEQDQAENPEEIEKKREWIEKRKWMSENSHLLETDEDESQSLFNNSRFLKISKSTLRKIESFVDTPTSDSTKDGIIKESSIQRRSILEEIIKAKTETKKSMTALTSCSEGMGLLNDNGRKSSDASDKSMSQPLLGLGELSWTKKPTVSSLKKGSFLSRGGMMLSKLAEATKSSDAVSNIKVNSRNFVFSHITPPNPDKTDGSTSRVKRISNPSKATCGVQAKKAKIDRSFNVLDERSKGSIFKHFSN